MKYFSKKVIKPWGYEIIFTEKDSPYTAKLLHIKSGCRLSLQYHDQKKETLVLFKGQAKIVLGNQILPMEPKKGYYIKPFLKHRVWAVTDCDIFEASTPEIGNTFRLEDDYQRQTETEADRKKR